MMQRLIFVWPIDHNIMKVEDEKLECVFQVYLISTTLPESPYYDMVKVKALFV